VSSGQSTFYTLTVDGNPVQNGGLATFLLPYLNEPEHGVGTWSAGVFLCPAWTNQRASDGVNASGAYVPGQAYQADQVYMGRSGDNGWGSAPISDLAVPANVWALREIDKASSYAGKGSDNGGRLVSQPVHGSFRNNLYYDGHVEALPLSAD
jgi:prepilin-type processing-associated H-X9-DG protein